MLIILHVAAKIHVFFWASLALDFGEALRRAAHSPSSLFRVVVGRRGRRLFLSRYLGCSLRVATQRHLRNK